MIDLLPQLTVLASFMIGLGYAIGNTDRFSIWRLIPAGFVYWIFSETYSYGVVSHVVIVAGLLIGFLVASPFMLEGFTYSLGLHLSNLRHRKAYEDIRRKEAEVEAMRREYEAFKREQERKAREEQQQRRQRQSDDFRQQQKQQSQKSQEQRRSSQGSSGSSGSRYSRSHSSSSNSSTRAKHLETLGLDPNGNYSFNDIKKAYRRQASKFHPDKHQGKGKESEMTKRFQAVQLAYEWVGSNQN